MLKAASAREQKGNKPRVENEKGDITTGLLWHHHKIAPSNCNGKDMHETGIHCT